MRSLTELLTAEGIGLRSYGEGEHKTTCPKCSATRRNKSDPCLSVRIDAKGATWNCHHCPWRGAVSEKSEMLNPMKPRKIAKPERAPNALPEKALRWFAKRKIPADVLTRNKVGHSQEWMPGCGDGETVNVIAFPYYRGGELVNVKYRTHDKRFRQVKGAEKVFFGLDDIEGQSTVIICEGECDKLALEVAGYVNAVSVPDGAPQAVKDQVPDEGADAKFSYVWSCRSHFEQVTKIILATDGDTPGQALAEELARRYGKHRCYRVTWPNINDAPCKDANDVLIEHGAEVLRECIEHAQPYPIKSLLDAGRFEDGYLRTYRGEKGEALSTGWPAVDAAFKIRRGLFHVITGVPSSGKSQWIDALLMNMMENYDWNVAYCSFENDPAGEHLPKLAELHARAPFYDGPISRMSESEARMALSWLKQRVHFIRAEDESPTIEWVLDTAKAAVMRHGIQALVIDPWNEIEHRRAPGQSETEYVSDVLSKVKRFARAHEVAVFFVAHPAKPMRKVDGSMPEPSLYDISGSAHWVNKADIGIIVARDWQSNRVTLHVKKVRFRELGRGGEVQLEFARATGRYAAA